MAYTLTVNYDNPPVAIVTLTSDTAFSTAHLCRFKVYSDNAGTQLVANSGWITPEEGSLTISYTFSSLPSGTYYVTAESDQPQTFVSLQEVALADNTPRTATQSQWEDLAARVKAKSDVQITMTNTDPGEGSALAENNYVAVYGGDPIILDYSTNEVNTGAKWIDGSAIYKKTISVGALPNSTTKNTAHNISNLGQVLRIEGFTTNGTNTYEMPRVMIGGTQYQAQIQINSTNIQIDTGDDLSSYTTTYITLYYTKSSS